MNKIIVVLCGCLSVMYANTLEQYANEALKNSSALQAQKKLLQSSQYGIEKANSAYYPTLNVDYSYTKYAEYKPVDQDDETIASLKLKYNLFNNFKDLHNKDIAINNFDIQTQKYKKIENKLLFDFVKSYINVKKNYDLYNLSKINNKILKKFENIKSIKFKHDDVTLKDYSKSKKSLLYNEISLLDEKLLYENSIEDLKKFVKFDEKDISTFAKLEYENIYKYKELENKLDNSILVVEAKKNIDLFKSKMKSQNISLYPKVDIIFNKSIEKIQSPDNPEPTEETSAKIALNWNLFNGFKDKSKYNIALYKYQNKIEDLNTITQNEKTKLKQMVNKFKSLKSKLELQKKIIKHMKNELTSIKEEYKYNMGSISEIVRGVNELHSLKKSYINNKYSLVMIKYQLYYQLGILKQEIFKK